MAGLPPRRSSRLQSIGLVVALLALWLLAWSRLSRDPTPTPLTRIDRPGAVAYPIGDAGCDFQNALAILSGDGWVNWRAGNRWSVYKPGWAVALATVAALTEVDTARMQRVLTAGYALAAPAFALVLLALVPGRAAPLLAALGAIAFVFFPPRSWWFARTMMTEGPTLLLALLVCWLAMRALSRRIWRASDGVWLGLAGGILSLVRSQGRFALLALLAVILLAARRPRRGRAALLLALLLAYAAAVGPYYLKTSWQIGQPFFGTAVHDLVTALAWTRPGKAVGGQEISGREFASEAEALDALEARAAEAVRHNLRSPLRLLATGARGFLAEMTAIPARLLALDPPPLPARVLLALLAGGGLLLAVARRGAAGAIPLAFAAGYVAPSVALSYFLPRFADPIAWVGLAYVAVPLGLVLDFRSARRLRLVRRARVLRRTPRSDRAPRHAVAWRRLALFGLLTALWIVVAAAALVAYDRRPFRPIEVAALFAEPGSRELARAAGVELDEALRRRVETDLQSGAGITAVEGIAHLPLEMSPGESALASRWLRLRAAPETYTAFFLATPWKSRGGRFGLTLVTVPGELYAPFRQGDRVLVMLAGAGESRFDAASPFAPTVSARLVLPVRR